MDPLGLAKVASALGLWIPALGIAAAIALILYFTGAVITVLRARSYKPPSSRSCTWPRSSSH